MADSEYPSSPRERFEVWADDQGFCMDELWGQDGNNFVDPATRQAFDVWMAALDNCRQTRAELPPELKSRIEDRVEVLSALRHGDLVGSLDIRRSKLTQEEELGALCRGLDY